MRKVELEPGEWGQVMQIISTAPWNVANPLLMKIGDQLRQQEVLSANLGMRPPAPAPMFDVKQVDGAS
jgi:hypothetical protein